MYPAKLPDTQAGCEITWLRQLQKTVYIHDVEVDDCINEQV